MPITSQLRRYRVRPGQMAAFVDVWRTQVVPARRAHGYTVDGAWLEEDEGLFVWVVSFEGDRPWDEVEAAYYASPERTSIDPSPTVFLATVETELLRPVA